MASRPSRASRPTTLRAPTAGARCQLSGDSNYIAAANATGDLVVSQAATSLGSVSGTASFGGTATLDGDAHLVGHRARAIAGETVSFTLDGTSVGTAVTDSSGVATLTASRRRTLSGTDTGGVVASFAGDTNYIAAANAHGRPGREPGGHHAGQRLGDGVVWRRRRR